ncbi:baseplate J/gp47 family protein [Deinococcus radiotolerans]|uniref:Baseplate protein J-like domain-containing protein n=1 Tax=Deinococcus radiotolerans TaxID=1309407 RepID=A0ABQ2FQ55_9DEIO|nr:baseplate J/gp47 family protein [Deinococcus radiotolerans]GGL15966.1 hypothetical protein GCM10010844_38580 [Deinococcus radiotolerans]
MALADLIRPRSREQVVGRMLNVLAAGRGDVNPVNFAPTNYVPGDPLRTLLELTGEGVADVERTVEQLGLGGYLSTAHGAWLDALVESQYGLSRQASTFARFLVRFSAPVTTGLQVPAGMIVGTGTGLRYTTREAVTLEPGASADVLAVADSPGAAYNVPAGTITVLHTPLPGLSVTNPPGSLLSGGADTETDDALRVRASGRWAELGGGATRRAYEFWALTSHPSVDRVLVLDEHPRGQGTVDVVLWGEGGLGSSVVTAADEYIQARRPVTADVQVYSAHEINTPVPLDVYAPGADPVSVTAQIQQALAALQRSLGIGQILYHSAVIEAAMLPAGVLDVTTPLRDTHPTGVEVVTLAPAITFRSTP